MTPHEWFKRRCQKNRKNGSYGSSQFLTSESLSSTIKESQEVGTLYYKKTDNLPPKLNSYEDEIFGYVFLSDIYNGK